MADGIDEATRRRVLIAQCLELGHDFDVRTLMTGRGNTTGPIQMKVGNDFDSEKIPHLSCRRCPMVWLLVESGGEDYDAAEADLIERMPDEDPLTRELRGKRERRSRRGGKRRGTAASG